MRLGFMHRFAVIATCLLTPGWALAFETNATAAYIYDQSTGTVLLSKNADTPLPPASMSKLMTIYMAFEAVADGRLDINEELPVSSHAASYGGSSMFLGHDRPCLGRGLAARCDCRLWQ